MRHAQCPLCRALGAGRPRGPPGHLPHCRHAGLSGKLKGVRVSRGAWALPGLTAVHPGSGSRCLETARCRMRLLPCMHPAPGAGVKGGPTRARAPAPGHRRRRDADQGEGGLFGGDAREDGPVQGGRREDHQGRAEPAPHLRAAGAPRPAAAPRASMPADKGWLAGSRWLLPRVCVARGLQRCCPGRMAEACSGDACCGDGTHPSLRWGSQPCAIGARRSCAPLRAGRELPPASASTVGRVRRDCLPICRGAEPAARRRAGEQGDGRADAAEGAGHEGRRRRGGLVRQRGAARQPVLPRGARGAPAASRAGFCPVRRGGHARAASVWPGALREPAWAGLERFAERSGDCEADGRAEHNTSALVTVSL